MRTSRKIFSTSILSFLISTVLLSFQHTAAHAQLRGNLFAILFDVLRGDPQPSFTGPVEPSAFDGRIQMTHRSYLDLQLQNLNADQINEAMQATIPYTQSLTSGGSNNSFFSQPSFTDRYSRTLIPTWSAAQRQALRYRFATWTRPPGTNIDPQFPTEFFDVSDRSSPVNRWYRYRYPFSAIGVLTRFSRTNEMFSCSATIVGPDLILTANHCLNRDSISYVFSTTCGGNAGRGAFVDERRVDATPIARATGEYIHRAESSGMFDANALMPLDYNRDWAFLRLAQPLGDECGYLPVARPQDVSGHLDHNVLQVGVGGYQLQTSGDLSARVAGRRYDAVATPYSFHVQPQCMLLANQAGLRGVRFSTCDGTLGDSGGPLLKLTPSRTRDGAAPSQQLQLGIAAVVGGNQYCWDVFNGNGRMVPPYVSYFNAPPSRECFRGVLFYHDPQSTSVAPVQQVDRDTNNLSSSVHLYYRNIVISNSQFYATWCRLIGNDHPNCRR